MKTQRIRGLNRRIFKHNLRAVLKPKYATQLQYGSTFAAYIDDYEAGVFTTGKTGTYEVGGHLTKSGNPEVIETH